MLTRRDLRYCPRTHRRYYRALIAAGFIDRQFRILSSAQMCTECTNGEIRHGMHTSECPDCLGSMIRLPRYVVLLSDVGPSRYRHASLREAREWCARAALDAVIVLDRRPLLRYSSAGSGFVALCDRN